jgi:glutathione S-transferase
VLAHETGLFSRLQLQNPGPLTPVSPNAAVIAANPLGKIPTLVLDDGSSLADSRVICEYLDAQHDGDKLFPAGEQRFRALTQQALADGLMDTAVALRYETFVRPAAQQWGEWIDKQKQRIDRVLDAFEQAADGFAAAPTIGTVAIGCALGYLDFRFADDDWRGGRARLAGWFERFGQREAMRLTVPE